MNPSKHLNDREFRTISRREMLAALPALALMPRVIGRPTQTSAPALGVERLHSFGLRVADVPRSVDFYQSLFGMPIQARQGDTVCLRLGGGPQFMSVSPTVANEQPSISHICLSAPDFDVDRLLGALDGLGVARTDPPAPGTPGTESAMRSWVQMRGETPEVFFADASGLILQLQDPSYCGGGGPLGSVCSDVEPAPSAGEIALEDISHFTVFGSSGGGSGAVPFYQDTMGFAPQAYQATTPALGIGDGIQFLMFAGGGGGGGRGGRGRGAAPAAAAPATIHHASFNMKNFDADALPDILTAHGLTAANANSGPLVHYISLRMPDRGGAEGGTPELYFTDPDGLLLQIQDTSYCGGGGILGDVCDAGSL